MDAARAWVRSIAVLVMVAAFLDFLMPQGNLRRFARVVMGLFVLLAILQPVVTLMHQEIAVTRALMSVTDRLPAGRGIAGVSGGDGGAGSLTVQTVALAEKGLAKQVEGIVASVTGSGGAKAEVKLDAGDGTRPGGVSHVRIVLLAEGQSQAQPQPQPQSQGQGQKQAQPEAVSRVTIAIPSIVPGPNQPASRAGNSARDRQAEINRIKEVISGLYVVPPDSIEVIVP